MRRHERARGRPRGDQGDGRAVTSWTGDELARIGAADELELAALRRDGTLRKPVTIWVASSVGIDAYWLDSKISLRERTLRMDEGSEEHAFGVEEPWVDGWDCTVVFDDEVVGGIDREKLDQLRDNLAASEGITEVVHEYREVFHLKVLDLDLPSVEAKVA